ncbi:hypothetical protein HY967_00910, partial [Candidatus Jorgensenbacteria bacterium]|nr:hypothetical protein [Candidatus Jorgensenbacteria bacterium]
ETDGITGYNTSGNDAALAVAVDASSLYVAGYENATVGLTRVRVEKRDKTNGSFVSAFGTNGAVSEYHVTQIGGTAQEARAIALDGDGVYIAGNVFGVSAGGEGWLVQKRDITNGDLLWEQIGDRVNGDEVAYGIALDTSIPPSIIYVAGSHDLGLLDDSELRFEKSVQEVNAGTIIRGPHIIGLQDELNRLRQALGSSTVSIGTITAGVTPVSVSHLSLLQSKFREICPNWSGSSISSGNTVVKAEHFNELSRGIEGMSQDILSDGSVELDSECYVPYYLVNNLHTNVNCLNAGGTIYSNFCRFSAASCASVTGGGGGWQQYLGWSATQRTCSAALDERCGTQCTSSHGFSDNWTLESTIAKEWDDTFSRCSPRATIWATRVQVGCY